jgi:uncharacterized protein (DUF305 family)
MSERVLRRSTRAIAAGAIALAGLALSACTAVVADAPTTAFVTPAPPGGTMPATGAAEAPGAADSEATAADAAFLEAMVAHHEQAVELAGLAPGRAADSELAELAARILSVQAAEAEAMRGWLDRHRARDLPVGDHAHVEAMSGEISRSTFDRALTLEGAEFDRLFLAAMLPHHRGAVEMSEARLAEHGDAAVTRWARAIATSQAIEIDRLREIEARLEG